MVYYTAFYIKFIEKRYIKIENKPIFVILNNFEQKEGVVDYFDNKCREIGFNGIYLIESIGKLYNYKNISKRNEAVILREPDLSYTSYIIHNPILRLILKLERLLNDGNNSIKTFNMRSVKAEELFDISLKYFRNIKVNKKYYPGIFAMWDNTYRHDERGYKIYPPSQEKFIRYLKKIKEICKNKESNFIFFNAWNEWAEGMTLEPSNNHGYRFLEGIKEVFGGS